MHYFSKLFKWVILIITTSAIISCASIKNEYLNHHFYHLQPLPSSLQNKVFLESLTFEQENKRTLLTQIETQKQTLSLGGMTYSGLPIIQAKWDNHKGLVDFSSDVFDKAMVLRIIRDIQLVKWPDHDIQSGLLPNHQLTTTKKSNVEWVREIKQSNKPIITIIYTEHKTVLINAIEHYQLTIEQVNE